LHRSTSQAVRCLANDLTAFVRQRFSRDVWLLRLPDVWGHSFDLLTGNENSTLAFELIPEWLTAYRDRFRELSSPDRRFVRYALGEALAARVGRTASLSLAGQPSADLALAVLRHPDPPKPRDLSHLLRLVAKNKGSTEVWEGCWAFARASGESLLRLSLRMVGALRLAACPMCVRY
jgi:hypothetical protein